MGLPGYDDWLMSGPGGPDDDLADDEADREAFLDARADEAAEREEHPEYYHGDFPDW